MLLGLVVLLLFGPKRLPEMGRSFGKGLREFKDSVSGEHKDEHVFDVSKLEIPKELSASEAHTPTLHPAAHAVTEPVVVVEREVA
jgi:sec-independent protein translocase protein TatA